MIALTWKIVKISHAVLFIHNNPTLSSFHYMTLYPVHLHARTCQPTTQR
jgi:hypothetical protein